MARTKQARPVLRQTWSEQKEEIEETVYTANGVAKSFEKEQPHVPVAQQPSLVELLICMGGIYASFLSWAVLQERITTTPYGDTSKPEIFTFSVFLNTIQSAFACVVGYAYLRFSSRNKTVVPSVFPSRSILGPLTLVAITQSLASPFGYASLKHVGSITFLPAKSCKLVPVMLLHVSVFRRKYPLYKYAVVALVTAGVATFTLQSSSKKTKSSNPEGGNQALGISLIVINLLFDGLTNSTQDYINATFAPFSGAQMMCAQNAISTLLTSAYLLLSPYLAQAPVLSGMLASGGGNGAFERGELAQALAFVGRHPSVTKDVLSFAATGAVGQVFIFLTLAKFSSLVLVTITVTRKMLTMLLSVVWFGHSLSAGQWLGVGLVFGGVGAEAAMGRWEKNKRARQAGRENAKEKELKTR